MSVTPTAAEVIEAGQLQIGQFPSVAGNTSNFSILVDKFIALTVARFGVKHAALMASTDANTILLAKQAVMWWTLGDLWQSILSTMAGFDAEALPPEFVDVAETATNIRDVYWKQASDLLEMFDTTGTDDVGFAKPYFGTAGIADDDVRETTMVETWVATGEIPE